MKKITILWFGSKREFARFTSENVRVEGIEYRLVTNKEQCRGVDFDGYVLHYSADKALTAWVYEPETRGLLFHLMTRSRYGN